jgi:hypothetical protein
MIKVIAKVSTFVWLPGQKDSQANISKWKRIFGMLKLMVLKYNSATTVNMPI